MAGDVTLTREQVLRFRFERHQLDRDAGGAGSVTDVDLLDYGVQDTGTDGAMWALTIRGAPARANTRDDLSESLFFAWTIRGAPHAYRRSDLADVALATTPYSDADAARRIFDANKPLKDSGIECLAGLTQVARELREIAKKPTVKGDASGALNARLPEPFLRFCRACDAIHIYEQPFRLSALQAGLELDAGTSPPVLRRIKGFKPPLFAGSPTAAAARFDVVRNYLRFFGPARRKDAATFLDASAKDVEANWPDDAVPVTVEGEPPPKKNDQRWLLADDVAAAQELKPTADGVTRLVGPYDAYLQLRDRELLVADEARRKDLWRVLGRPGAVVVDGDVVGTCRPRTSGTKLTVTIDPWIKLSPADREAVDEQAERLAAHRGLLLNAVDAS